MNPINRETQKKISNRIVVGMILAVIGLPLLFLGGWYVLGFMALALFFAVHEFTNARPHNRYNILIHAFIMVMTYSFVYWVFVKSNLNEHGLDLAAWSLNSGLKSLEVSTIGIAVTVAVLFLTSILDKNFTIDDATYLITMVILIGLAAQSILFLRFFPGFSYDEWAITIPWWQSSLLVFYVFIGTFMSDIGAYFIGILFGRNKMNPRISPKKTWEGFFGGVAFSALSSMAFGLIVAATDHPMLPFLSLDEWYWIVILSLTMPLMANLGDFLFSAIKRHFDIKDYSTILQEHGGILDRIDSLLMTSLYVAIVVTFISTGWNLLA